MARELSCIKVKIGLRANGEADHPNFNILPVVQEAGMDWSKYIDVHGMGWHYDHVSGHEDNDIYSPAGQQWAMLMVPKQFADEAVTLLPETCFPLTEAEAKDFYDNKAHALEMDEHIDSEILNGIKLKQDLGGTLTQDQLDALDPLKAKPGIKKNEKRYFDNVKTKKGLTFLDAEVIPAPVDVPKVAQDKAQNPVA